MFLDTATRGWQCPRPRWESPNPALENVSTEIPSVPGPQKYPPQITAVQITSWKFPALSSALHPKQRQMLWWKLGFYRAPWSPWDSGGCVLMSYLMYFQISLCLLSSFCDHEMSEPCCQGVPVTPMVFLHPPSDVRTSGS